MWCFPIMCGFPIFSMGIFASSAKAGIARPSETTVASARSGSPLFNQHRKENTMPEYTITDIVEAINKLDASKRSEIIAKLSAAAAPAGQLRTFSQSILAASGNPKQLIELKELRAMAK